MEEEGVFIPLPEVDRFSARWEPEFLVQNLTGISGQPEFPTQIAGMVQGAGASGP